MKFTILSHAGMLVEEQGTSILMDPWLIGSVYWRSWWNFPEMDPSYFKAIKPNYIYLTHLHWDHFQGPSLKLFSKDTKILLPKVNTLRMVKDMRALGFKNIQEIPHGTGLSLAPGFDLYSYQSGPVVDSAIVLTNRKTTLLNSNDTKSFGLSLKEITNRFKKIDFVFRSHSSATCFPYCIENYKNRFSEIRTAQDYINEFTNFALHVGAKYAIPFASNHCFVHKDTLTYNNTSVSPADVSNFYNPKAERLGLASRCVVMPPGSTWDDQNGFHIEHFDYSKKQEYVESLCNKYEQKLKDQYVREEKALANFNWFETYFTKFLNSLPLTWLWGKYLKIIFRTTDPKGENHWLLDFVNKKVHRLPAGDEDAITIETPALVLNDCTRKKMFSVWAASKRLKIILPPSRSISQCHLFLLLLDLYETDSLPLAKNFSLRSLSMRLRRWRDIADFFRMLIKIKVFKRQMTIADLYPVPIESSQN